ncbi:MAG TPA: DddA-like double-stranded DNA deaminase toxin [Candidatus Dormibacteraeota bacterium]|jgi:hypothetical protein|nr:DddA-like double-stranded DNA deaminase toxin [Candidatus Dormibacteraeota bacterium]
MEELHGGPGSSDERPTDRAEEEGSGEPAASMGCGEELSDHTGRTGDEATARDRIPGPRGRKRWLDPVARGRLPAFREGGRARGLLHVRGTAHALESGYRGPSRRIAGRGVPGFNNITLGHVEGHAAAIMRMEGVRTAILEINRVPCQGRNGCEVNLRRMLPPGARLHVFGPDSFFRSYVGDPDR